MQKVPHVDTWDLCGSYALPSNSLAMPLTSLSDGTNLQGWQKLLYNALKSSFYIESVKYTKESTTLKGTKLTRECWSDIYKHQPRLVVQGKRNKFPGHNLIFPKTWEIVYNYHDVSAHFTGRFKS